MRRADPRVRLAIGTAGVLLTAVAARRDGVGRREARAFRLINRLPDAWFPPVWTAMQAGTLGAAPVAAAAAWTCGDRKLARRLLLGGTATWAASKAVKWVVRRPRPPDLLEGARCRGREPSGLGYLSGHAGVVVALAVAASPRIGAAGRALALGFVGTVGLSRIYVGAHLPLDVAGGASLGLAIDALVELASPLLPEG